MLKCLDPAIPSIDFHTVFKERNLFLKYFKGTHRDHFEKKNNLVCFDIIYVWIQYIKLVQVS